MHYIAKIIFRVVFDSGRTEFDEQLRLISAPAKSDAAAFASMLGKKEEDTLYSETGAKIKWEFIGILGLWEIERNRSGALVHSSSFTSAVEEDYIKFVRERHSGVLQKFQIPVDQHHTERIHAG